MKAGYEEYRKKFFPDPVNPIVEASRNYRFEASHQPASMPDVYGTKESGLHGHNFELEVFTKFPTSESTGLSVDLNDIDYLVENVISSLDHRNLIPDYFQAHYPITHEFILDYLSHRILHPKECVNMIALSTDVSYNYKHQNGWGPHRVYTYGGIFMDSIIFSERSYQFSACHKLLNKDFPDDKNNELYGKCTRLHGHDYILSVTISGIPNKTTGVVIPYKQLDKQIKKILKKIDGKVFSDLKMLEGKVATTENLLMVLWPRIKKIVDTKLKENEWSGRNVELHDITIQETARNFFTYKGENSE